LETGRQLLRATTLAPRQVGDLSRATTLVPRRGRRPSPGDDLGAETRSATFSGRRPWGQDEVGDLLRATTLVLEAGRRPPPGPDAGPKTSITAPSRASRPLRPPWRRPPRRRSRSRASPRCPGRPRSGSWRRGARPCR